MNFQVGGLKHWQKALLAVLLVGSAVPVSAVNSKYYRDIFPRAGTVGRDGRYYGTTLNYGRFERGTAYLALREGDVRVIYHFPRPSGPDGSLTTGNDGAIYGATREGGAFRQGFIYKLETNGRITILRHLERYGYRGPFLNSGGGDLYLAASYPSQLVRYRKDGSEAVLNIPQGEPISLVETAAGEILLGTYSSSWGTQAGALWKLNSSDEFEKLADVGYLPHTLVALDGGAILCLVDNRALRVSPTGEVEVLHEFTVPFEGLQPNTIFVAEDGSYVGSTYSGGVESSGVLFRIDPESKEYTVLKHLPHPGGKGFGLNFLQHVVPLMVPSPEANLEPMARDDVFPAAKLKRSGTSDSDLPTAELSVLKNDADFDRDPLVINGIGTPAHGTAVLNEETQTITYTAATTEVQNDMFSYTIGDGNGGSATAWVFIQTDRAGTYEGELSTVPDPMAGDPGTPVGTLSVRLNSRGTLAGEMHILGEKFKFSGRLNEGNEFGKELMHSNRNGKLTAIKINARPEGAGWYLQVKVRKDATFSTAECRIAEGLETSRN